MEVKSRLLVLHFVCRMVYNNVVIHPSWALYFNRSCVSYMVFQVTSA